jgi:hypothetical protein
MKIDVYAYAISIYELINMVLLTKQEMEREQIIENVKAGIKDNIWFIQGIRPNLDTDKIEEFQDIDCKRLISDCWLSDPDQRPSMDEVLRRLYVN